MDGGGGGASRLVSEGRVCKGGSVLLGAGCEEAAVSSGEWAACVSVIFGRLRGEYKGWWM